ncbi:hypothetical protein [uncultured Rhodospira sp.]|uniref:hypothetical protein n=1 Tax=uncultured Rhodospira sp. TaxID=1936189 RepID=UPI00260461F2|nr:hypothetical protein [uncultured Rhodospira sp.]
MGHQEFATTARARRHRPGKRFVCALVLGLSVAVLAVRPAQAIPCPGEDAPVRVELTTRFDTARVDHSRGRDAINAMFAEQRGKATIPQNGGAVGLTVTRSGFSFSTRTEIFRRRDGALCVYLRGVEAAMNQVDTVVYIAREYPKGSCNYRAIYEHEKMHVGVYYFTQKDYAPRVERELERLVRYVNPRVVRNRAEAREVHVEMINEGVAHVLEDMEAERRRRNAALDTPENYARERAKCPSW